MSRRPQRGRTLVVALACLLTTGGCAWLERSSVSSAPANVAGGGGSFGPSLSRSGRYVAFASDASDLVPGDTNHASDVFVRDHLVGTTERVGLTDADTQIPSGASGASISDDGRFVGFVTTTRLAAGDTDDVEDSYVRDRTTGATTLASVGPDGAPTPLAVRLATVSGDGRHVAFATVTTVPAGGEATGPFVRHLDLATTTAARLPAGITVAGSSVLPLDLDVSDDGSRVVYDATSAPDGSGFAAIADGNTGAHLETISTYFSNPGAIVPYPVAISGDGTRWAFVDNRGALDVDLDLTVGTVGSPTRDRITTRYSRAVWLSDDGTVVAWLLAGAPQRLGIRATAGGDVRVVSANAAGNAPVTASSGTLSGDGKWVAFSTSDPAVAPGDARGVTQVYTRSTGAPSPDPE